MSNLSAISWREQVTLNVCFVLDQHAQQDLYSTSSMKQQPAGRHVTPFGHSMLFSSQASLRA